MASSSDNHWFYTNVARMGNTILYRGFDRDGNRVQEKIRFKPTLYALAKDPSSARGKFRTMRGEPVEPINFADMAEAREYMKMYEGVRGYEIFGDIKMQLMFIQSRFPSDINFSQSVINTLSIDIETRSNDGFPDPQDPKQPIYTIALRNNKHRIVLGTKDFTEESDPTLEYRQFTDEAAMLEAFLTWFEAPENTPDVLTGWNIKTFDVPYLLARIGRVLGEEHTKRLSPWGKVSLSEETIMGQTQLIGYIEGLAILDYLDIFKKFTKNTLGEQENYKLGHIAEVVLGETKEDYSDYGSLEGLYEQNYNLFVRYNIRDVDLIAMMDKKLGLLSLVFTMAYMAGTNYEETLGTTTIWDCIIYRHLARKGVVIPPHNRQKAESFAGGYVKEVQTGLHEWVVSYDVKSMYPNIIVQYNMSPETLVPHSKQSPFDVKTVLETKKFPTQIEGLAMAANGSVYRKDVRGVIPELVQNLYDSRVKVRDQMVELEHKVEATKDPAEITRMKSEIARLDTLQTALKILMNSLYGAMGSPYFRYFNLDIAEGITLTGQLVNQWVELHINTWISSMVGDEKDRVVAMDTDSIYVCLADVVKKFEPTDPVSFLDKFSKEGISKVIDKAFKDFYVGTSGATLALSMKRENIANRAIWSAGKRYILNVMDKEGTRYKDPKMKIVGIEAIKSSTPKVCREELKSLFKVLMSGTEAEMQARIAAFRTKFKTLPPEAIAFPANSNDFQKYADKKTIYGPKTFHISRACLVYNWQVRRYGLESVAQLIRPGDKIKWLYLLKPNDLNSELTVAFPDTLHAKLNLSNRIDYDTQFEKAFLGPLQHILDVIGWSVEARGSLDEFFV